jgi:hypothetical protein
MPLWLMVSIRTKSTLKSTHVYSPHPVLAAATCPLHAQFVEPPADDVDSDDDAAAATNGSSKYLHELPQLHEAPAASLDINTTRQVSTALQQLLYSTVAYSALHRACWELAHAVTTEVVMFSSQAARQRQLLKLTGTCRRSDNSTRCFLCGHLWLSPAL